MWASEVQRSSSFTTSLDRRYLRSVQSGRFYFDVYVGESLFVSENLTVPSVKTDPLRLLLPVLKIDTCAMSQVVDHQVGGSLMGSEDLNLAIIGH